MTANATYYTVTINGDPNRQRTVSNASQLRRFMAVTTLTGPREIQIELDGIRASYAPEDAPLKERRTVAQNWLGPSDAEEMWSRLIARHNRATMIELAHEMNHHAENDITLNSGGATVLEFPGRNKKEERL